MENDKKSFFDSLDRFEDQDQEEEDIDNLPEDDLKLAHLVAQHRKQLKEGPPIPTLQYRRTAPVPTTPASFHSTSSVPKIVPPLRRVNTFQEPMTKRQRDEGLQNATNAKSKRTKVNKIPLQPIERQIFRGLVFFFYRNNEKSGERKMRMEKAREYGAEVVLEFSNKVTHIIVDKDLKYVDVLKHLEMLTLPPKLIVVNPQYPGDCIKNGKLLEPNYFWYYVPGCPEDSQVAAAPAPLPEPLVSSASSSSLQVQARPKAQAPPLETPNSTPEQNSISDASKGKQRQTTPDPEDPKSKDALDEAIEECMAEGPGVDLERFLKEDSEESASDENPEGSDDEDQGASEKRKISSNFKQGKTGVNTPHWQSHFQCMKKNDGQEGSQNPNSRTIEILGQMMRCYEDMRDQWRTRTYRMVITSLKKMQDKYITTYEEAIKLPGVGDRLAKKIVEIVTTDRLERLEYAKLEPTDQLLKLFTGIYGVGYSQAQKFVAVGYKDLDDIAKNAKLTEAQKIGLEHYYDFQQRIPRDEVTEHGDVVAKALQQIDDKVESIVMGSYRRGNKDCGDIDIIITKEGASTEDLRDTLEKLVTKLFSQQFLMCGLAIARHDDGTKWHGASRIGGPDSTKPWRRIDFLVVPGDEIGAALIYFTGNDIFNRSIRLLASKKGMRLNQRGLYGDVMRGAGREKYNEGSLLESKSEKRIFEILGVPYRPPEHRIC